MDNKMLIELTEKEFEYIKECLAYSLSVDMILKADNMEFAKIVSPLIEKFKLERAKENADLEA